MKFHLTCMRTEFKMASVCVNSPNVLRSAFRFACKLLRPHGFTRSANDSSTTPHQLRLTGGLMKSIRLASSFALITIALIAAQSNPVAHAMSFAKAVSYYSGGQYATSFAVGDLNGDGKPDLVVGNQCASNPFCSPNYPATIGVLLANGDGTFQSALAYDPGQLRYWANAVAIGDVNGDGKPDIVLALTCKCDGPGGLVSVLLGSGDGTFQPAVIYDSGGFFPSSIAIRDLNGDGHPDIVVAECQSDNHGNCLGHGEASVLLGNGDGTFRPAVSYASGGDDVFTAAVAVGDVNGDGVPDLVLANTFGFNGVAVLIGKGDGTFKPAVTYSAGFSALSVAIGDVNGDGHPDLVVANACGDYRNCNGLDVGP